MHSCALCGDSFELTRKTRAYCSESCAKKAWDRRKRAADQKSRVRPLTRKCDNCKSEFELTVHNKLFCSNRCSDRVNRLVFSAKRITAKSMVNTFNLERSRSWKSPYTPAEIAALRSDPMCILPNRTLLGQWKKCKKLSIRRDASLHIVGVWPSSDLEQKRKYKRSAESKRRANFRDRMRRNPEPILSDLRALSRGHQHAEDIVVEGFATALRLAIPAAEAFKIAKAEVNRTSAQPFREQSFNPEIDYAARETGRQVARASEIRAARGEG